MKHRAKGFSLLELLISLVIIGMLAAQVYPSFHKQVIRTRRQEAEATLLQLMQQQERLHTQSNTYVEFSANATSGPARLFKWWSGSTPATSAYELEGKACDGEQISQCVQIIAKPGTSLVISTFRDEDCQRLILTSTGLRLASGSAEHCWP